MQDGPSVGQIRFRTQGFQTLFYTADDDARFSSIEICAQKLIESALQDQGVRLAFAKKDEPGMAAVFPTSTESWNRFIGINHHHRGDAVKPAKFFVHFENRTIVEGASPVTRVIDARAVVQVWPKLTNGNAVFGYGCAYALKDRRHVSLHVNISEIATQGPRSAAVASWTALHSPELVYSVSKPMRLEQPRTDRGCSKEGNCHFAQDGQAVFDVGARR